MFARRRFLHRYGNRARFLPRSWAVLRREFPKPICALRLSWDRRKLPFSLSLFSNFPRTVELAFFSRRLLQFYQSHRFISRRQPALPGNFYRLSAEIITQTHSQVSAPLFLRRTHEFVGSRRFRARKRFARGASFYLRPRFFRLFIYRRFPVRGLARAS